MNAGPIINNLPPSHADSERERRLQLREMERKKRLDGIVGGDYGHVG